MYEEDIEHALRARKYNAIRADERELINAITYDTEGIIKRHPCFGYSEEFISELQENNINVCEPDENSDEDWTFTLPPMY
ncbi:tagatose-bisphosphate aldolase [Lactiplantibacillus pentosus]|uniref:tagatose-bisphosphate aldolase n=1 Tax=Lactiplantibacillus pentosus TaxID=1589 RepID=UPI001C201198|nr:tagatose-bisphosphate aldolase [Lactiplantibacillus pentosus]MBU7466028.1 tagatose-bisphosphate aldolase [Lactiplantibacillus pentosus]MBU7489643.1 tagatose-bisphosphate aldolase [Lactiplantibacillus pentosus]MDT6967941.1 tagatose-bisphosphate aldolase [Lactiplantibacillus pentosus]MDT6968099.1 tagatose-bisphosphate aldolase [Lactiplantibacillus pentosus]MDT6968192.1 tagatose-bisphosphate aldolase [Lactiplantibacillus pentosus]